MKREDNSLYQDLLDIGLSNNDIDNYIKLSNENDKKKQVQILAKYRGALLESICDNQERIYRLDYLMRLIKKQ